MVNLKFNIKFFNFVFFQIYFLSKLCCWEWRQPTPDAKYNEASFLVAHNAYSAFHHGYFPLAQQKWSIKEQLEHGIRGLMLDTYKVTDKITVWKGIIPHLETITTVRLCHGSCAISATLLRPGEFVKSLAKASKPIAETLKSALVTIKDFLEKNQDEVVTIFFEDYVRNAQFLDEAIKSSGIDYMILKPSDWSPYSRKEWPTISWMQKNNKRVVILSDTGQTNLAHDLWTNVLENQFSTINIAKASVERDQSRNRARGRTRYLYLLNFFHDFPIPHEDFTKVKKFIQDFKDRTDYKRLNSTLLREFIGTVLDKGLEPNGICRGRIPNFIAIDFVNEGDGLAIVNKFNDLARDPQKRSAMYKPIPPTKN